MIIFSAQESLDNKLKDNRQIRMWIKELQNELEKSDIEILKMLRQKGGAHQVKQIFAGKAGDSLTPADCSGPATIKQNN